METFDLDRRTSLHLTYYLYGDTRKRGLALLRLKRLYAVDVSLRELFEGPTVRELAQRCVAAGARTLESIPRAPDGEELAAAPAQRRIYALQALDPESVLYNVPFAVRIRGSLDPVRLEDAIRRLIGRHESLRTGFVLSDSTVRQRVADAVSFTLEVVHDRSSTIEELAQDFLKPFDLAQAPLVRMRLISRDEQESVLLGDIHHIVADGASMEIIVREIAALYEREELAPVSLRYRDFSAWQAAQLTGEPMQRQRDYWAAQFATSVPVLKLPTDRPRPPQPSRRGATVVQRRRGGRRRRTEEAAAGKGSGHTSLLCEASYRTLCYDARERSAAGVASGSGTFIDTRSFRG